MRSSAGTATFAITNRGAKVTEFHVYAAGDNALGELENIAPGKTGELRVELPAGTYETACRPGSAGKGIRGRLTVKGESAPLSANDALALATDTYQRYVWSQAGALLSSTQDFATAVKKGDVARAKELYPVARTYWERIEPVAGLFGTLDPRVDGRVEVIDEGLEFTGFHRLERDLWETGDVSKSGPYADKLVADVTELVTLSHAEKLSPLIMANGAKELLDEIATGKITGEENRYSHTDLWDFQANLEGSATAIDALRPFLRQRAPALLTRLDAEFENVFSTLREHRVGAAWKLHDKLSQEELKELSDAVNALAEPVSKVAAVVAG